jgi:hypothetical protein
VLFHGYDVSQRKDLLSSLLTGDGFSEKLRSRHHRWSRHMIEITEAIARKVLSVVDRGLSPGLGKRKPGEMCVEAAVCYALDLPHGDDPACVSRALRSLKIRLNDSTWSSKEARAKGLRRLAVAQLGSRDHLDDKEFVKRVAALAIRVSVPLALRAAASIHKDPKHQEALREAANKCEREPIEKNAREAHKIAYAAAAAAASDAAAAAAAFAEGVVQILIEMNAPGCQWLALTELEAA